METFQLALDHSERSPQVARHAVGEWFDALGCSAQVVHDVTLIVSELVTNAVVHGDSAPVVHALFDDGRLRLEVQDDNVRPPVLRQHGAPVGGFGLRIVATLADSWGWTPTTHGKRVWTELLC